MNSHTYTLVGYDTSWTVLRVDTKTVLDGRWSQTMAEKILKGLEEDGNNRNEMWITLLDWITPLVREWQILGRRPEHNEYEPISTTWQDLERAEACLKTLRERAADPGSSLYGKQYKIVKLEQ